MQPDQGSPPDQAVQPDLADELPAGKTERFPDPVVVPPEPTPAPSPVALSAPDPIPVSIAPPEPPPPLPKPEAPTAPAIIASTPEGRILQKESATLLQLAEDLKAEIEKAGTNTLSLAALRKAEEIQRMTKDLKDQMSKQGQTLQSK